MNTAESVSSPRWRRKLLWLTFWFFLIASPFLGLLGPIAVEPFTRQPHSFLTTSQLFAYVAITFAGATVSGWSMAQLRGAKHPSLSTTLRFGCAICTLYLLAGALMIALRT